MTAAHGPARVPGVRRPPTGPGAPQTGAHGSGGGREGSSDDRAAQSESATCEHYWMSVRTPGIPIWIDRCAICGTYSAERMAEELDAHTASRLADMTRQRDEAVKAFQRERARVSRAEALRDSWLISAARDECRCGGCDGCTARVMALELRAALADRPTDDARKAREAAVSGADDAGVAGQGSDAERAGEGK